MEPRFNTLLYDLQMCIYIGVYTRIVAYSKKKKLYSPICIQNDLSLLVWKIYFYDANMNSLKKTLF